MLLPEIFGEKLLDDWMDFPEMEFPDIDRKLYGKHAANVMKTDVHEQDDRFDVDIDLPGFKKDEIKVSLNDGYLTVNASKGLDKEKKDHKGKLIRQERYSGTMQRSFYVGDSVTEEEIKAKFENGVLQLRIPKKETAKLPDRKLIAIEG